jgi:hypothetical protein
MNYTPHLRLLVVSVVLSVMAPAAIYAQGLPERRQIRPLFGSSTGNTEQALTLRLNFGGAYDDNILAGESSTATDVESRSGIIGQLGVSLGYRFAVQRFSLAGSIGSGGGYYPDLIKPWVQKHSGNLSATYDASAKTRISASQSISYDPRYTLARFPAVFGDMPEAPPVADDTLDVLLTEHVMMSSAVEISQEITRRVRAGANVGYSRNASNGETQPVPDLAVLSYGGRFTVNIARGLDLRLGYGQSEGRYDAGVGRTKYRQDNIDAGIDFNRALSLTRKTHLGFTSGATGVESGGSRQYRFIGSVRLTREIGRSWSAGLALSRDVGFWQVFREPVLSDGLTLSLGGLIGRRVQLSSGAGANRGDIGLSSTATRFTSYYASSSVQVGLTQSVGVSLSYSFYRHVFDGSGPLPLGVSPKSNRQSIRASVNLWAPLIERTRRPDASR